MFCQRWNKSRSWQGKSINKQIIILPLTSVDRVWRKRSILKKCDISRNQVPAKSRTITPIPLLNSRVTKEDTLQLLRIEFSHMRTNIPNKTSTPKYPRLNGKQRFMGKEGLKRSGPIQDRRRHLINQKISGGNSITTEVFGHVHLKQ